MKRKYREAMRIAQRLQDAYIDGLSDDEEVIEARDWHDDYDPQYVASADDRHLDEQRLPF